MNYVLGETETIERSQRHSMKSTTTSMWGNDFKLSIIDTHYLKDGKNISKADSIEDAKQDYKYLVITVQIKEQADRIWTS